jgi:hypothetical protein
MDVAGARALEQRIADGKPVDPTQSADLPRGDPPFEAPLRPAAPQIEVVYLHPQDLPRTQRLWVYVRGPAGRLRRAR